MSGVSYLRELLGVLTVDLPRYSSQLIRPRGWIGVGNRIDRREVSLDGTAVRCLDEWSSDLHACRVVKPLGTWLFRKAFSEWPIRFASHLRSSGQVPELSFVIPHRGADRIPLLYKVIETVFAQEEVNVECLVVEQDQQRHITALPPGVRYLHVPHRERPEEWHKSLAFNAGVREATAEIVVCHDGDLLMPCRYALELRRLFQSGISVAYPQRFLFHLSQAQTTALGSETLWRGGIRPESIRQNWKGGTVAIRRDAYVRIGGFDERFVGWTGEDVEFHDRCQVLPGWFHGYLPFIHLWHVPQTTKTGDEREANLAYFREIMAIPRKERIANLRREAGTAPGRTAS